MEEYATTLYVDTKPMTFDGLEKELLSQLPQIGREVTVEFGKIVAKQIQPGSVIKPPDHRWGVEGKLYNSTKALSDSWQIMMESQNTIFHITVSGTVARIVIGSELPYAVIQNRGGQIQPTPRMVSFFWAMYYQSKDEFWKGMALHGKAGKPITIKPTNYLTDAERVFAEDVDKISSEIIEKHIQEILQ